MFRYLPYLAKHLFQKLRPLKPRWRGFEGWADWRQITWWKSYIIFGWHHSQGFVGARDQVFGGIQWLTHKYLYAGILWLQSARWHCFPTGSCFSYLLDRRTSQNWVIANPFWHRVFTHPHIFPGRDFEEAFVANSCACMYWRRPRFLQGSKTRALAPTSAGFHSHCYNNGPFVFGLASAHCWTRRQTWVWSGALVLQTFRWWGWTPSC